MMRRSCRPSRPTRLDKETSRAKDDAAAFEGPRREGGPQPNRRRFREVAHDLRRTTGSKSRRTARLKPVCAGSFASVPAARPRRPNPPLTSNRAAPALISSARIILITIDERRTLVRVTPHAGCITEKNTRKLYRACRVTDIQADSVRANPIPESALCVHHF